MESKEILKNPLQNNLSKRIIWDLFYKKSMNYISAL